MIDCELRRIARVALLACTLVPAPALAQTPPDTFRLNPIVVTATRLPLPRAAAPAAVTVLEGRALREQGIRFVSDALRQVAGAGVAQVGARGGLTSLFLRGGESDYVQVMIDGVVLNEPGGTFDFGQLTTTNVERIEIVRGPTSVLYGSDAVAGVVHIITRDGAERTRLSASAGVGTTPRRNGEPGVCPGYPRASCPAGADLGHSPSHALDVALHGGTGRVGYAFEASRFDTEGAYAFNSGYGNTTLSGRASVDAGHGIQLGLTTRWTDGRYHYATDGAGRLVDRNQYRSSESLALGADVTVPLSPRVEAQLSVTQHDGEAVTDDPRDGPADTLGTWTSTNRSAIVRRKLDVHANVRMTSASIVTVGAEIESQSGESAFRSNGQFGPFESSSDDARDNRAGYAQLVTRSRALTVTVGGRAEDNDRFGTFLTWRAGANLSLGSWTRLRAAAGSAFKEPTFFENYATGFVTGNAQLEPETSRSWEIGVERQLLNGRVSVGATWFDQRFRNLIQYLAQPAEPEDPNYVNLGEAKSAGLELEVRAALDQGTTLNASWTWLDTKVLDEGTGADALFQQGESLIRRPRHRASVVAAAPIGARVRASLGVQRTGSREDLDFLDSFTGDRITLPAYTTVDLSAELRPFASRDLGLLLRVDNLLDADYREVVNFPSPGRTIFVSLRTGIEL